MAIKDLIEKRNELEKKQSKLREVLLLIVQCKEMEKELSPKFVEFSFNDANIKSYKKEYERLTSRIVCCNRLIAIQRNLKEIERIEREIKWLESDFCKHWLNKMKFTTRKDGDAKYLFLSIMPGYKKMTDHAFNRMCHALCLREFGEDLCAGMYLCGKVDWTMFYKRPKHVNGEKTCFYGTVFEDDFSPEDWDKNHDEYWFDKEGYTKNYKKNN